jgi:hypothetical protein
VFYGVQDKRGNPSLFQAIVNLLYCSFFIRANSLFQVVMIDLEGKENTIIASCECAPNSILLSWFCQPWFMLSNPFFRDLSVQVPFNVDAFPLVIISSRISSQKQLNSLLWSISLDKLPNCRSVSVLKGSSCDKKECLKAEPNPDFSAVFLSKPPNNGKKLCWINGNL